MWMELSRTKIDSKDQRPQQCRRSLTRRPLSGIDFVSNRKPSITSRATDHCIASRCFSSSSYLDRLWDLLSSKSLFKASFDKNSTNKSAFIAHITVNDWANMQLQSDSNRFLNTKLTMGLLRWVACAKNSWHSFAGLFTIKLKAHSANDIARHLRWSLQLFSNTRFEDAIFEVF